MIPFRTISPSWASNLPPWKEARGGPAKFKSNPCRLCGCTDDRACPGGCYWYEDGVYRNACAIGKELIKGKKEAVNDQIVRARLEEQDFRTLVREDS